MSLRCTACGRSNPDDAHFCANCGAALKDEATVGFTPTEGREEQTEVAEAPVGELERGQALLVVERGPNAGSTFLLHRNSTTIGRSPQSDIFLDDVTVSRRHAEIHREGGRFYVQDVGSLNGTYVNLKRVDRAELANRDELQIGRFKLAFYVGE